MINYLSRYVFKSISIAALYHICFYLNSNDHREKLIKKLKFSQGLLINLNLSITTAIKNQRKLPLSDRKSHTMIIKR